MNMTHPSPSGSDVRGLTRRGLLARALAAGAICVVGAGFVAARDAAWAVETAALKPETMATLIQMARDIYPHDRIADRFYAIAVKTHDDPEQAGMIEAGVSALDLVAQGQGFDSYLAAGWEKDRVAMLRMIEHTPFFQTIRAGLVTGLYNQKEIWPLFGYEGESYSHGGYIERGFNDIDWL
ncbi:Twin-arginine translocation pathway signal [Paracoccus sp. (in: a-proteobacteria)]|uniref:Twin-arginine translocation pathway signal n=1 Tax=Paracoccus sp. TaxID=267 RepID=UPI002AFECD33|nr:Twin-arginine translocation pathway signal [Paracoccus sp. (in: a-proteobacteria)]